MDSNSWREAQGIQIPSQAIGGESAAAGMEGGDWRSQLRSGSRKGVVNTIMEMLKKHLPFSGQEGLQELQRVAARFEEKIYTAATSQSDYLEKITLKMMAIETKSQNSMANSGQSNAASNNKNPQDPVSDQSQVRQQLLSQNNIASNGVPNSDTSTSTLPTASGMSQGTMSNVPGQDLNMQNIRNMSDVAPKAVGNSMGQGMPNNIYANSQRQIQGTQQQVVTQEQQQQSQNSQQYHYNQQLKQYHMKHKFQQGGVPQSMMQSQMHLQLQQEQQQLQQNLLLPNQLQYSQQAVMQSSLRQKPSSSTLQNQQSSQSMRQQQSQFVLGQRPHQQPQQLFIMQQHQMLPTQQLQQQQQQKLSGQQPNTANIQQSQIIDQQNSILDQQQQQQQGMIAQQNNIPNMQQQHIISQPNNLPNLHQQQSTSQQNNLQNMHQQQLGPQANLPGIQQQQMVGVQGNLSVRSNLQPVQQSKVSVQQQMQPNMLNMLPNQAQQSQSQPMQQRLMSQVQSQQGQLQQQMALQQQENALQRDMPQRIQTSGPLLQQQTAIDQQKQLLQSRRDFPEVPITSIDSSTQTGNANGGDWQEETHQKIKYMNEMYLPELNEMYQRMASKLHQHDALPQQAKKEQLAKLRFFKVMLERLIRFLRTNKNEIQPTHKENIFVVEKQIIRVLSSNKPRKHVLPLQQGQLARTHMHDMQQHRQQQPQISQMHKNEGPMNSPMQLMNVRDSAATTPENNLTNLLHESLSSGSSVSNSRKNMMDALQPGMDIDSQQGNALNHMQQVALNSLQQNPVSGSRQMNINSMSSQSGLTTLQSNVNSLPTNSNILQPQQINPEQQTFSTQQPNLQYQQPQMQQQYMQKQQLIQQRQQEQTTQQLSTQLPTQQQMMQLNQMNDTNDMKMLHQMGRKSGVLQAHNSNNQRPPYHDQQMKPGTPFSISAQQVLQAASPQMGHHPSPQIDQLNLLACHTIAGTPMQSATSPFIVPSPTTSMAPSPVPGGTEKINSGTSSLSNAGNSVHHLTTAASIQNQSLSIGTSGISASPLLTEFISPDGTHGVASTIASGTSNVVEQPLQRLLKAVKSMSPEALSASVNDISSVVNMVVRITESAPGYGSRAAVGEDLVAMTKWHLQARNFFTQDGPSGTKKMRRHISAIPSNVVSSSGSTNDSSGHFNGYKSDGDSSGASSIKRPRIKPNHALEEELREINQRLIDSVVYIGEDDADPTADAATEVGEGTIVKCSFSAVALSPNLKSQYASAQMSPIQPLKLLIPNNYPNCSPILLDKFPDEVSKEYEDLSLRVKSRFTMSLRTLAQPLSLRDIARTWDKCACSVISEYAQQSGGGTFSSKYGMWENCLSAA